ncbi:hypothetical protein U1Q18_015581 [Sarracenia purpurea var. burkii]
MLLKSVLTFFFTCLTSTAKEDLEKLLEVVNRGRRQSTINQLSKKERNLILRLCSAAMRGGGGKRKEKRYHHYVTLVVMEGCGLSSALR